MPLTSSGIWYPDGNFSANPRVIAAQQAANIESVITTERLRHGSTDYNSVAARDAANPTPVVGDQCTVAGWPQVYYSSTRGWVDHELRGVGAYMEVTQSTSVVVPSATWTLFSPITTVDLINPPNETIFRLGATGILFDKPGYYDITLGATGPGSSTGRRLAGWSPSNTITPLAANDVSVVAGPSGTPYYCNASFVATRITDPNGRIAFWMYQDSGSSITFSGIRAKAYYRGVL